MQRPLRPTRVLSGQELLDELEDGAGLRGDCMRISYASLPDHPVAEIVETIALADELGFTAPTWPTRPTTRTAG